jgi:hypothetical protein
MTLRLKQRNDCFAEKLRRVCFNIFPTFRKTVMPSSWRVKQSNMISLGLINPEEDKTIIRNTSWETRAVLICSKNNERQSHLDVEMLAWISGSYVHKNVRSVRSDKCLVRGEPDPTPAELGDLECDMRQCAARSKVTGLWRRGELRVKIDKKKTLMSCRLQCYWVH